MTKWDSTFTQYEDTPDRESVQLLVKHFARTLSDRVTEIFPDALGVKYVTAPALKRQVWNAVLAITDEIQNIPQFRHKLLTQSNRHLLQDAYSNVPAGFRLALRKTGPYAQSRDFYIQLHQHLTEHPTDYRFLNGYEVDERLIDILRTLPTPLKSFQYARRFSSTRDVTRFKDAWILLNHSEHKNPKIWTDAAQQFDRGFGPTTIIHRKFNQTRFPEPVVTYPHLKHIGTVGELVKVAKKFNNCLADYINCALRNDLQFYEYLCGENPCIVSIKNDGPYGYVQCDIKGLKNSEPDFITEVSIKRLLNDQGVMDRPRVTRLVKYAGQIRPYKPSKNPSDGSDDDDIGLEELMVDENDLPF